MKILYGITKSNFGGAQRYVFDLACEAKRRGHKVAVILGEKGSLADKLTDANIKTISIPGFSRDMDLLNDAPRLLFIMKTVWENKPDIFHINSSKMGGAGGFTTRVFNLLFWFLGDKHRIKVIFTSHGWAFNETWRPGWQKLLIKIFSWLIVVLSHETICVSEKTRENISKWPFIKNKLVVIHNGIDSFELIPREEARKKMRVNDEKIIVGTLAELHKVKGLDILLEAWRTLPDHTDNKLLILGQGEEAENLQNMAKNTNLEAKLPSVELLGFVENARTLLLGFDIFVLPSRSENLPYAILEAGSAGLPVVASRVGGIPEIITNGDNGLLVEPENSSDLADTLQMLIKDAELRTRLGKNLKETISKNFSKKQMFEKTFASYLV